MYLNSAIRYVHSDDGGHGAICRLSLSFNNEGPLGTFFRYTCDNGTWVARYDDLIDGKEPNAGVGQVLPCYRALAELDRQLAAQASSVRN